MIISSCYSRKEGCIDTLSNNFDVFADDACNDCCTYPSLILNFKHMLGDSIFRIDTTLTNSLSQKFSILDVKYYLSDFNLFKSDGQKINIIETIYNADKSLIVNNDMKIARNSITDLIIGSIISSGQFDSLTFNFGLSDKLLTTSFVDLASTHVLLNANRIKDSTNVTSQFSVKIKRNLDKIDTINLFLNGDALSFKLKLDSTITTNSGQNIIYSVKVDYLKLFDNIDLKLTKNEIQNLIKLNLPKFLIVK
jgi:hypothetical protein